MGDIIDYKIYGDDMQIVEIELDPKLQHLCIRAEEKDMLHLEHLILVK
ncbi:AIM24 family protein [Caloranaerobacter azorensis]